MPKWLSQAHSIALGQVCAAQAPAGERGAVAALTKSYGGRLWALEGPFLSGTWTEADASHQPLLRLGRARLSCWPTVDMLTHQEGQCHSWKPVWHGIWLSPCLHQACPEMWFPEQTPEAVHQLTRHQGISVAREIAGWARTTEQTHTHAWILDLLCSLQELLTLSELGSFLP